MREDRSVLDLLDADYTFVNERLARHYGIPNVYGPDFRRVPVPSDARRGLLGHGSLLLVTSNANRTSPVMRGKWILENLLGSRRRCRRRTCRRSRRSRRPTAQVGARAHRAAPRESGVRGLPQDHGPDRAGARELRRDRPLAHDGRGRRRSTRRASSWTARRSTARRACARRCSTARTRSSRSMTEKLLMYGVGRETKYYDMPAVRTVMRDAAKNRYRFSRSGAGRREERAVSDEQVESGEASKCARDRP